MKKSLILLVLFFVLYSCGIFHFHIDYNQGRARQKSYYEKVGFDFIRDKVILPVTINGEVRRFIFDTGAITIISESLQEEMEYDTLGREQISDINGNTSNMTLVRTDSLFIGELEFNGIPALVADLSEPPWCCLRADGFIGSNLLRNSVVQINKEEKECIVTSDVGKLRNLGRKSRMKLDRQSSPHIKFSIAGGEGTYVLFDSGSDDFVNISQEYFKALQEHDNTYSIERRGFGSGRMGMFGAGKKESVYRLRLDSLRFDQTTISGPVVDVTNANSNLGARIFHYGVVTLDYRNEKFYFSSSCDSLPFKRKQNADLGFHAVLRQDTFRVGLVWENSLVDSLGLKPGHEIVRINEYNFRDSLERSFCKIWLDDPIKESDLLDIRFIDENGDFKRIKMRRKE